MNARSLLYALSVSTCLSPLMGRAESPPQQALPAMDARELDAALAGPEGRALMAVWKREGNRFTPTVKKAYLAFAKAAALRELKKDGITLPADFLDWVDGDAVVAATVYGSRHDPASLLTLLRSLEIDLGQDVIRQKHTQLALAMAVVHSVGDMEPEGAKNKKAANANVATENLGISLAARPLLELRVPGNPLVPVNTHPTDRPLDANDHIINFFEGRTVEVAVKAGKQPKGAAAKPTTKTVPMAACDVIADPALQKEFNAYMKSKGQSIEVHCGDHVVSRDSKAAVKGPEGKGVLDAYRLFKSAYEAKGLLPAQRDATPTLAETFAWLIRNEAQTLPAGVKRKWDQWPVFPLDAPWPVLTYLAQWRQPLREAEDIFVRYRDKGEFHGYGEYIGPIAQQFDFQSARRLAPYDFAYGTFQMMLKDGGVCGTMANMQVRSELALGIPSTTAGQPGHCALVSMRYSPADKTYSLAGGQFATGGPEKTTPHLAWVFADDIGRRPMIYPMTTPYAVNFGFQAFLDSSMAWKFHRILPSAERKQDGFMLLGSALALNPYNIAVVDGAVEAAATPEELLKLADGFEKLLAAVDRPGCPKSGLYNQTVLAKICARLATMTLPSDRKVLARLADLTDKSTDAKAWQVVHSALGGPDAVKASLLAQLRAAVTGPRTPAGAELLAGRIQAVITVSPKSSAQSTWVGNMLATIQGKESFTVGKAKKLNTDPCVAVLLKAAGKDAQAAAVLAARAKAQSDAASQDLSKGKVN